MRRWRKQFIVNYCSMHSRAFSACNKQIASKVLGIVLVECISFVCVTRESNQNAKDAFQKGYFMPLRPTGKNPCGRENFISSVSSLYTPVSYI